MKKIRNKIISVVAVFLGLGCGTGIVAAANEIINNAYVEDGFVYTDPEKTDLVTQFYVGEDGELYIDPEMSIAVPHKTDFEVNENGETYGTSGGLIYYEDEPDLIAVIGNNGIEGYVRKTELETDMPSCPEEAMRMQEERERNGNSSRIIDVYESDGITIIDTFTVGGN